VSKGSKIPKLTQLTQDNTSSSDLMGQLLVKTGQFRGGVVVGQKVEGKVVEVTGRMVILDIGSKAEGLVVEDQFDEARDFIKTLSAGDKVTATVVVSETMHGQALLSLRDTAQETGWVELENAFKENAQVEFKVLGFSRGGLSVVTRGVEGFVPISQMSASIAKNIANSVGKTYKGKIVESDRASNKLVLSERAVSESEMIKEQIDALKLIESGEKLKGKVVGIANFGAFVQIKIPGKNGKDVTLDGLVHLSELSWQKVVDPAKIVKEGEVVEVVVIGKELGKLALSIKKAQVDPWQKAVERYKVDGKVSGKVVKINESGAFVELEPGVEGLLRTSKIPSGMSLKDGQTVECFIEEIDKKNRKIGLGLVLKVKPVGYK